VTEIKFIGPEYDGAEQELKGLAGKLVTIANDTANSLYYQPIPNPTDLEITPVFFDDEPMFVVNAWHETAGRPAAKMQLFDFTLRLACEDEDAFLATEDERKYPLTTRETFLIMGLSSFAIVNSMIHGNTAE
jgi:hypothetical protein